jgi:hypothetical protein
VPESIRIAGMLQPSRHLLVATNSCMANGITLLCVVCACRLLIAVHQVHLLLLQQLELIFLEMHSSYLNY